MKAFDIEDGYVFTGTSIGSAREVISGIVFNTSMTGYLEVMARSFLRRTGGCMDISLIGNYGICCDDQESRKPWIDLDLLYANYHEFPATSESVDTIQYFLSKTTFQESELIPEH